MGNYLAVCISGDIQSKQALMKKNRILQIIKVDGKILEFTNPLIVRDLLVNHPNYYVGMFKEATQPLPLDHKLKIGKIYYLLPSFDHTNSDDILQNAKTREIDDQREKTMISTTIKVVITKEQLQQILRKQGGVEELLLGVIPSNKKFSRFEGSSSSSTSSFIRFSKLASIPEEGDILPSFQSDCYISN